MRIADSERGGSCRTARVTPSSASGRLSAVEADVVEGDRHVSICVDGDVLDFVGYEVVARPLANDVEATCERVLRLAVVEVAVESERGRASGPILVARRQAGAAETLNVLVERHAEVVAV